jgi:hypothetical protein
LRGRSLRPSWPRCWEAAGASPRRRSAGQLLGRCGTSGTYLPHLHFEVFESVVYGWDHEVPVSFRNASGPLDSRGGLARDVVFLALACE